MYYEVKSRATANYEDKISLILAMRLQQPPAVRNLIQVKTSNKPTIREQQFQIDRWHNPNKAHHIGACHTDSIEISAFTPQNYAVGRGISTPPPPRSLSRLHTSPNSSRSVDHPAGPIKSHPWKPQRSPPCTRVSPRDD